MANQSSAGNSETNYRPLPMDDETWQKVANQLALSGRSLQIVDLILRGRVDKEIAEELGISYDTVRTHLKRISVRTGVKKRNDLVLHIFALAQTAVAENSHHKK